MNLPKFTWIYLKLPDSTWIYLNLPEFTWIYLYLPEFTWVYLNLPEFTWIYLNLPEGLGSVRILYSKISVVFHNDFSSNGRAGLMLLLSLLLAKNRFVLSDLAGRLRFYQVLGHCISWSRGIVHSAVVRCG